MEAAPLIFYKIVRTIPIRSIFYLILLPSAACGQSLVSDNGEITSVATTLLTTRPTSVEIKRDDPAQSLTSLPGPDLVSTPGQISVSTGIPVKLQLDKTISSAHAKPGDRLDFVVLKNVEVDGYTVIEAGSLASGSVVRVSHKRMLGIGGKVVIRLDSVKLITGETVPLSASKVIKGGSRTRLMFLEMLATGLSYLPAAPVFLLSRGGDSTVLKGMEVTAYTASRVIVPTANLIAAKREEPGLSQMIHFLPPRAVDRQGHDGDMLNLAFVAKQSELEDAFARSGWIKTEKTRFPAFWHLAMQRMHYAKLPMRALYVFGRPQDYSYALPDSESVVAKRHHIRIWRTEYTVDGTPIWVGAATYDVALQWEFRRLRVFHRIDPRVDAERDFIAGKLSETKLVSRQEYLRCASPVFKGETATGGAYYSDSRMLLVDLHAERSASDESATSKPSPNSSGGKTHPAAVQPVLNAIR